MALHLASQMGHLDVVRLLLEKGAGIEAKGRVSAFCAVRVGCNDGN
jgi:ankyrin repeat protein